MFKGIALGSSLNLSHLFYADDVVFVGKWSDSNVDTNINVLDCFYRASWIHINMSKSKLLGISVDDDKVDHAALKIGCATLKTHFSYLGSKVEGRGGLCLASNLGMRLWTVWSYIVWNLYAAFFNGADISERKPVWLKWKNVLASKEKGGLGVSSLYALNRALMVKWVWRFLTQSLTLWARVIKPIHGDDGKIGKSAKSMYHSILLDIVHELELIKKQGIDVINCIHKKLGNGENTLYGRMFDEGMGGVEQTQFAALLAKVEGVSLVNMRDRWVWSLEGLGDLSVDSVKKLIDDKMLLEVSPKTRWSEAVPIKVNVLAWKLRIESIPTRFNNQLGISFLLVE
nr:RNA-directed DNA polymerase, eukaryota, reverse transcriptase zinc-binding domain protein [Tanacetum cinerariifolium]